MNKNFLLVCFFTFLLACQTSTNNKKKVLTDKYSEINNSYFLSIDSLITNHIDSSKIPGAVAFIAKKGQIAYNKAFGFRSIENKLLQKNSDIFRLASMTKPITLVAAMMLYEEGKFKLDEPLSKYIPEFANPKILDEYVL